MEYSNLLFPNFLKKCLTLSYDDGVVEDVRLCQIMLKHGLKGTFNLNSGQFAQEPNNQGRLTKQQAQDLYKNSNFEVAVHGCYHLDLPRFSCARAVKDIVLDREQLEDCFGTIIRGMAYAFGTYNEQVVELIKNCGIKYSRTIDSTKNFLFPKNFLTWHPTCHHDDEKLFELLDEFLVDVPHDRYNYVPKLFYLWGHSYEFKDNNNWDRIELFAEKVGNRQDVWYATNIEIYNYITAYKNLEFSVDETMVYNPTDTDVYLFINGKKVIAEKCKITKIG